MLLAWVFHEMVGKLWSRGRYAEGDAGDLPALGFEPTDHMF